MMRKATGYQALADIASSLDGTEIFWLDGEPSQSDIDRFREANAEVLRHARSALAEECTDEFEFTQEYMQMRLGKAPDLRELARCFGLELKQAGERGDFEQVTDSSCELLALGNVIREGAFIFDAYLSVACESSVAGNVRKVRKCFPVSEAKRLAEAIIQSDLVRKPYDEILVRDRTWDEVCGTNNEEGDLSADKLAEGDSETDQEMVQLIEKWSDYFSGLPQEAQNDFYRESDNQPLAMMRLLAIELSLVAFQKVHGHCPKELSELEPELIPVIPLDPFSGKHFVYRPNLQDFLLYSPGQSGCDHGGVPGSWPAVRSGQADYFLDMFDYQCGGLAFAHVRTSLLSSVVGFFRRMVKLG